MEAFFSLFQICFFLEPMLTKFVISFSTFLKKIYVYTFYFLALIFFMI